MTKNVFSAILLLLSCYSAYSQEQTPAIEWIEPYNGGTRGGSITTFPGPDALFALVKGQNSISGSASISKFNADGHVKNQYITTEGGSANVPLISPYVGQDGHILVYIASTRTLRRYDAELRLLRENTVNFSLLKATPTLVSRFYLLTTTSVNDKTVLELKRMSDDDAVEWSTNLSSLTNSVTDIQTTIDNGVIIATPNELIKFSAEAEIVWSNANISGVSKLIAFNTSIMYAYTDKNNIIQLNTSNGSVNWTKSLNSESLIDFEPTSDNGCVFSTNTGLYKFSSVGDLQWKNPDYGSAKIATTGDGKIFVIKNNAITKLTFNNEQVWTKNFNHDYYLIQDINGASDFGLYVTAVKNGIHYTTSPYFILFKLAPPDTPCKTNFDIIGETATYCKTGSLALSSKISNVSMEYMTYLTDFSFQWQKNNIPIESANNYSYTASETGNYRLKVKQQDCEAFSREVGLNIFDANGPIIRSDRAMICIGSSTTIRASGCDGTVVWSTGERGPQIDVSPQTSTIYYALCEKMINNELCQSIAGNKIAVFVKSSSNLKIKEITGKKEFCEDTFTELKSSVTGGVAPFTYEWKKDSTSFSKNADISINEAGNYILSVVDSVGCEVHSDTLQIKKLAIPAAPVISSSLGTQICIDGKSILTTTAKAPTYQWYLNDKDIDGANNQFYTATLPGKYQLKITNENSCSSISENAITITQIIIPQPTISQSNDSLISSAATGNKWYFNTTELPLTAQKIKFTEVGNYQVKVFEKGCESTISANFIPIILANEQEAPHIQVYPNPTSDKVFIKSSKAFSYQLVDVISRLLKQSTDKSFSHIIDINGFSSGNYFVILQEENGNNFVRKLSVNQ